MTKKKREKVF